MNLYALDCLREGDRCMLEADFESALKSYQEGSRSETGVNALSFKKSQVERIGIQLKIASILPHELTAYLKALSTARDPSRIFERLMFLADYPGAIEIAAEAPSWLLEDTDAFECYIKCLVELEDLDTLIKFCSAHRSE